MFNKICFLEKYVLLTNIIIVMVMCMYGISTGLLDL